MFLDYGLTDSEVQVRIGRWVVRRVRFDDIEAAAMKPGSRILWVWNEHWCNLRPFRFVVLRRKSGWLRTFIINPPDPDGFLGELKKRVPLPA